ncbi:MAG: TetR/AcrR family transcriptional regulator [Candidatus Electrothrix sp. GW3-4]|uniref:TetR/AcrR family transcriptional regulator n=1 Tax=Candidatus Electrothrix sp. GW3-4 TaxID=3126740 RepID=UPI0030D3E89D
MGRGQKVAYRQLRVTVIEVATATVREHGSSSLTVRKIAQKIGCAVGTIYNVFSSLDEIILRVNGVTLSELKSRLLADTRQDDDAVTGLIRLGQSYVVFCRENYNLWSLVLEHKLAPGNTLPEWHQQQIDELFLLVARMVVPLVEDDTERAERAARVLWAGLHGICALAVSGKLDIIHAESAEVLAESLVRNYVRGLRTEDV